MSNRRDWAGAGLRHRHKVVADRRNLITVAHPHVDLFGQSFKERFLLADLTLRRTVFSRWRVVDLATKCLAGQLHAVANAQDRNAQLKQFRIATRRAVFVNAGMGPPDRMIPLGASSATRSAAMSCRRIWQYTFCSRTRRAISCAYCEPKSSTTIFCPSVRRDPSIRRQDRQPMLLRLCFVHSCKSPQLQRCRGKESRSVENDTSIPKGPNDSPAALPFTKNADHHAQLWTHANDSPASSPIES